MRPLSGKGRARLRLGAAVLVLVIFPVAYVGVLSASLPHQTLTFEAGWTERNFSGWRVIASNGTGAILDVSNDTLSVVSTASVTFQQFVGAESPNLSEIDVAKYQFLIISIRAPSVYVAGRIGIWTEMGPLKLVLAKTYLDTSWHTEVIDLRFFGISGETPIRKLELGWAGVQNPAPAGTIVSFRGLELATRVGGPS